MRLCRPRRHRSRIRLLGVWRAGRLDWSGQWHPPGPVVLLLVGLLANCSLRHPLRETQRRQLSAIRLRFCLTQLAAFLILLSSINGKPSGGFEFHAILLLPVAHPWPAPLYRTAEIIGGRYEEPRWDVARTYGPDC